MWIVLFKHDSAGLQTQWHECVQDASPATVFDQAYTGSLGESATHCVNVQRRWQTALQPHLSYNVFAGCLLWDRWSSCNTDCAADGTWLRLQFATLAPWSSWSICSTTFGLHHWALLAKCSKWNWQCTAEVISVALSVYKLVRQLIALPWLSFVIMWTGIYLVTAAEGNSSGWMHLHELLAMWISCVICTYCIHCIGRSSIVLAGQASCWQLSHCCSEMHHVWPAQSNLSAISQWLPSRKQIVTMYVCKKMYIYFPKLSMASDTPNWQAVCSWLLQ